VGKRIIHITGLIALLVFIAGFNGQNSCVSASGDTDSARVSQASQPRTSEPASEASFDAVKFVIKRSNPRSKPAPERAIAADVLPMPRLQTQRGFESADLRLHLHSHLFVRAGRAPPAA